MNKKELEKFITSIGFVSLKQNNGSYYWILSNSEFPSWGGLLIDDEQIQLHTSFRSSNLKITYLNLKEENLKEKIIDHFVKEIGEIPKSFLNFVREEKLKTLLK